MTSEPLSPYGPPEEPSHGGRASDRSRGVALLLAFFGGVFGLHRFYVGRVQSGAYMCLTLGGMGIWYLYDLVVTAAGELRDAEGLRVARWEVSDARGYADPSQRHIEELDSRLEALRSEVSELAERLDFAERMLARQRERDQLPPGGRP